MWVIESVNKEYKGLFEGGACLRKKGERGKGERDGRSENWTDERIHVGCFYDDIMWCLVIRLIEPLPVYLFLLIFNFFLA